FILTTLAAITIGVHLIPYLLGQGYDAGFAALAVGLVGLMQLPGRLLFLPLNRWLSRQMVTVCLALMQSLALAALVMLRGIGRVGRCGAVFFRGRDLVGTARGR